MRAGPIRKTHDPLVAEGLHLLGCQGAVHVPQSQTTSTVGSQGVDLEERTELVDFSSYFVS